MVHESMESPANPSEKKTTAIMKEIHFNKEESVLNKMHLIGLSSQKNEKKMLKKNISTNCLNILKEKIGGLELDKVSADLMHQLPKLHKIENKYCAELKKCPESYKILRNKIEEIQKAILTFNPLQEDPNEKRKAIQRSICEALKDPIYQALKCFEMDPLVHFLHTASAIIHNHTESMSVFEEFGSNLLGTLTDSRYSFADLKIKMEEAITKSCSAHVNNLFSRIFTHSIFHPIRTLASMSSLKSGSLDTYNAYEIGNYNAQLGTFWIEGIPIAVSAGPNPSHVDYQIFQAVNQRNENMTQALGLEPTTGPSHYQVILEGGENHPGPKERRNKIIEQQTQYPTLTAMALPLDGKPWKGTLEFQNITTTTHFIDQLKKHMEQGTGFRAIDFDPKTDNGFVIPDKILDDNTIEQTLKTFHEAFTQLEGTNEWDSLSKEQVLSKTLLLGYDAIASLFSLAEAARLQSPFTQLTFNGLDLRSSFNLACKQGIDRGVILNMLVRILIDAMEKKEFSLTKEKMYQYCGYTAGRAVSVEARQIIKERYEALSGFISLITATSQEKQQNFLRVLKGALPRMHFQPSHQ